MNAVTKLTNELKNRAKKLFKNAFNLSKLVVTVKDIKAVFPAFDGRKAIHWMNLIDKCETKLQEQDKVEVAKNVESMSLADFNGYVHELILEAGKKYEVSIGSIDWVGSISVNLSARDCKGIFRAIGTLNVKRDMQVSVTWSRHMKPYNVANINQGFRVLLSMFSQPAKPVAA
jgi:hypothetical protein